MQIKLFTIPVPGGEKMEDEMNKFLRAKKILQVENQLVNNTQGVFWCFCIKYLDDLKAPDFRTRKVDYKQVLDEESFQRFSKMREIRKRIAKDEGIPAFAVFTDVELAGLAQISGELTPSKMRTIKGIGEKKVEKYGHYFITNSSDEKS